MSLRLVSGWTNRERAVLRRSKGALDTLLPVGRVRDWNTIRTGRHLCILGMIMKGSIDVAKKNHRRSC